MDITLCWRSVIIFETKVKSLEFFEIVKFNINKECKINGGFTPFIGGYKCHIDFKVRFILTYFVYFSF